MSAETLTELRELDKRLQRVSDLLRDTSELFVRYYSGYCWPYFVSGPERKVTRARYSGTYPKLSVITSAMCGWAVSQYRGHDSDPDGRLSAITQKVAAKLITLPPDRLQSQTFVGTSAVFVSCQVLRFLASHARFTGELFDRALDEVLDAISPEKLRNEKRHSFLLYYCVLALEQIRAPFVELAKGIPKIVDLSSRLDRLMRYPLTSPSWADPLTLSDLGEDLQDSIEDLAKKSRVFSWQFRPAQELSDNLNALGSPLARLSSAFRDKNIALFHHLLSSVHTILKNCAQNLWDILRQVPSQIVKAPAGPRSWKKLRDIATTIKRRDWYSADLRDLLRQEILSQTSYAYSGDFSRLDVGGLAYSLAAAFRVGALDAESAILTKAISLIFKNQRAGRWSQVQPVEQTPQGTVHFPLNIEIPNAVLPVLMNLADAGLWSSWTEIDEIFDWVWNTRNRLGVDQGWCSDHSYKSDRIDLFVTAQVIQFLWWYRELRRRLVLRSTLERSALLTVRPDRVETRWDELQITDPESEKPLKNSLRTQFVGPYLRDGRLTSSSVLLYGPPGTSKTSIMQALANKLGWEFLLVSPADFLAAGGDQVEARSTLVFEILKRAKDVVVLFDEVEEFLLDRGLKDRPEGIFRFMTTSMLPKLQALKARRNIIFGVATNYKERLDKAITRLGRVDHDWAVLTPDFTGRMILLKKFYDKKGKRPTHRKILALAANTPFFSYKELEKVVKENGDANAWNVVPHPTAGPEEYGSRRGADDELRNLIDAQIGSMVIKQASADSKRIVRQQLESLARAKLSPETSKVIQDKIAALAC